MTSDVAAGFMASCARGGRIRDLSAGGEFGKSDTAARLRKGRRQEGRSGRG